MRNYHLLSIVLAIALASAGMPSCSCDNPEFVHMDFADDLSVVGPTMGEKAAGHVQIDSSVRRRALYFLVNESNAKCYREPVIDRFIDTNRLIREEIGKRYYELRVHFYHRGPNTDDLLKLRSTKVLTYCDKDIISEYVWRDGRPTDTLFYENGQVMGAEDIKLENMKKKP